jgi:hypothetical protein
VGPSSKPNSRFTSFSALSPEVARNNAKPGRLRVAPEVDVSGYEKAIFGADGGFFGLVYEWELSALEWKTLEASGARQERVVAGHGEQTLHDEGSS